MRAIEGVLCDMDGTLADTEDLHLGAWNMLLERFGHQPPSAHWNDDCIGLPDSYALDKAIRLFPDLAEAGDILEMKQQLFRDLVRQRGHGLTTPEIKRALIALRESGAGLAVGTNSETPNTQATLGAAGLLEFFPVIVTASMVAQGKPNPDIYLKAARDLGLAPANCVVLEDSVAGLEAARAAGCIAVGVTTTWPAERLSMADYLFDDTLTALEWALAERLKHA